MHHLLLKRDPYSEELIMAGTGPVALDIDYEDLLGRGGQGLVFRGKISDLEGSLLKEVGALLEVVDGGLARLCMSIRGAFPCVPEGQQDLP